MEYIYPTFERGRIMKTELLEALRDYSYSGLWLTYQAYSDGIIKGCSLTTDERYITVGEGIIKCRNFIFLLTEPVKVAYEPMEQYTSLKFRVIRHEKLADYTRYEAEFLLDHTLTRESNEIEICRFKLKRGSRLRYEYKDFYDIQTEFDTLNLADATWAGIGGNTLSKIVTDYFAREILKCDDAEGQDVQMAYICLQDDRTVSGELLCHYIGNKKRIKLSGNISPRELFYDLEEVLSNVRAGKDCYSKGKTGISGTIIMD